MTEALKPESQNADHNFWLRSTMNLARRAMSHGNHPFGALLVGPDGLMLMEQENAFLPLRDRIAHAERLLASRACQQYPFDYLSQCTLYVSAHVCRSDLLGGYRWRGLRAFGKTTQGDHREPSR